MGLGLSMQLTQQLSQRQELTQVLEQKLAQQMKLVMTLGQYLSHEDLIKGMIRYANEHNTWRRFDTDGFSFAYAGLPYEAAKPIADTAGCGFAHCQYNIFEGRAMGDWTLFVVEDMIPEGLAEVVALHERGEELSCGNHFFASKLEWAFAQHAKLTRRHISFVDKQYPSKFVDLTQEVLFPILPEELVEFLAKQGTRHRKELGAAEALIKRHPLPQGVLQRMEEYENLTERACREIHWRIGTVQSAITGRTIVREEDWERSATYIDHMIRQALTDTEPDEFRKLSLNRVQETYTQFFALVNRDFHMQTRRHLAFPADVKCAYDAAQMKERLVTVQQTIEDLARSVRE